MGSSLDNELFEDSDLMAEIGVELIDLLIVNGCQAIAKDWGNEDRDWETIHYLMNCPSLH